ncbi:dipeptidase E [Thermaurantimonas aggregans]|uniref:dipeptidase E n=1 Tax=Thermaurantimonas aggregans TaxID=2173829 RepID=A0A401XJE4_9FLAO|nr:dipeptidase PepE [Thermaurantimonas aggregans]GCD77167.1 dipeptidase E [Thermaurantimonas aggregans]
MKLLLASTSRLYGQGYLEYLIEELRDFFKGAEQIVFVPYARPGGIGWDAYTEIARKGFEPLNIEVLGIHTLKNVSLELPKADGIFIGGGNTFVLLKTLKETGHFEPIATAVRSGTPYMGSSAGSNVAGLTIGTTNDMPIVYPPTFEAFGFVPFNINPHYLDPVPDSTHMGETREQRILEFHHFNTQPVVGLREGSWLRIEGNKVELRGSITARIFRKDQSPIELPPGELLL